MRPYAPLMLEEFGAAIFSDPKAAVDAATRAIAAFERTAAFAPFSSKFDGSLAGTAVLSDLEKEGMRLFEDTQKGNCTRCHAFKAATRLPAELVFTNFEYNNIGVPRNMRIPANADPAFFDLGLCGPRRERLADERLCGAFKVPTLRNVGRRAAFMHNGFFTSLRDVVAFYATRDTGRHRAGIPRAPTWMTCPPSMQATSTARSRPSAPRSDRPRAWTSTRSTPSPHSCARSTTDSVRAGARGRVKFERRPVPPGP
jgi:cytochrome c peroxidase